MSSLNTVANAFKGTPKETIDYYQTWVVTYDDDVLNTNFNGPKHLFDLCKKHLEPSMKILDICAGTGIMSKMLKPEGFIDMDGHDGSSNMLQRARDANLYGNYYEEFMYPGEAPKTIPENTYDALIMTGSFCPGHLNGSHLPALLAPLKQGGKFVTTIRTSFFTTPNEGQKKSTKEIFDDLVDQKVWKVVEIVQLENFYQTDPGVGMVYEKL